MTSYDFPQLDRALFEAINHWRSPLLDWAMPKFSSLETILPVLIPLVVWRLIRGRRREKFFWIGVIAVVILGDMICARILKPLAARPRPFTQLDGIFILKKGKWLITSPEFRAQANCSFSWPSCHSMNTWTAAMFTARFSRWWGLFLGIVAALVCYSRVYLGVHYPSDVISGGLLGAALGWLAAGLIKKLSKP